jgi:hypothetical protein
MTHWIVVVGIAGTNNGFHFYPQFLTVFIAVEKSSQEVLTHANRSQGNLVSITTNAETTVNSVSAYSPATM